MRIFGNTMPSSLSCSCSSRRELLEEEEPIFFLAAAIFALSSFFLSRHCFSFSRASSRFSWHSLILLLSTTFRSRHSFSLARVASRLLWHSSSAVFNRAFVAKHASRPFWAIACAFVTAAILAESTFLVLRQVARPS